jgi:hypothetical protein
MKLSGAAAEYARPWKLLSLAAGIALLVAGAYYHEAPDWDVPISFIMAGLTYLTAPWSMRVLVTREWKKFPLMLLYAWFTVDGCYWAYWSVKNPRAVEMMRDANWPASLALYAICGLLWYYRGSLRELWAEARLRLAWTSGPR